MALVYTGMGSAPDNATLNQCAGMLDRGEMTSGQLGATAANLDLTAQNIDLVGLAQNGLGYLLVMSSRPVILLPAGGVYFASALTDRSRSPLSASRLSSGSVRTCGCLTTRP